MLLINVVVDTQKKNEKEFIIGAEDNGKRNLQSLIEGAPSGMENPRPGIDQVQSSSVSPEEAGEYSPCESATFGMN